MKSSDVYGDVEIVQAIERMAKDGSLRNGRQKHLNVKMGYLQVRLQRVGIHVGLSEIGTLVEDVGIERGVNGRINIADVERMARAGTLASYCQTRVTERSMAPQVIIQLPLGGNPASSDAPPPPEGVRRRLGVRDAENPENTD